MLYYIRILDKKRITLNCYKLFFSGPNQSSNRVPTRPNMLSKVSKALKFQFNKAIQLYGDRAGGQGNFEFAGLAEIKNIKFVLLKGNPHSLQQPADWRRFLRLLLLAQRIQKPVLLWNLPLAQNTSIENPTSLALGTAIKNTRVQLLKLTQPIVAVYEETMDFDNAVQGLSWADGTIVVLSDEERDKKERILKQNNLYCVSTISAIPNKISEILDENLGKTESELVEKRLDGIRNS